jgi:hypothetical protein
VLFRSKLSLETIRNEADAIITEINSHMQELSKDREYPLRTAEVSTEQNLNMIDSVFNNTPIVTELDEKSKGGEPISLSDLAGAMKAECNAEQPAERRSADAPRPSIREQLRQGKEQIVSEEAAKERTTAKPQGLEV